MNNIRKSETKGIILYRNIFFLFCVYELIFENILIISIFVFFYKMKKIRKQLLNEEAKEDSGVNS